MTLPALKVGQVWQCRDQAITVVKIDRIDENERRAYFRFKDPKSNSWGIVIHERYRTTLTNNVYEIDYYDRRYDLVTLLYDPND